MEKYKDFTRLFPVQKTLRMGLVPVGRTLDNIQRNEVLQGDEQLASNFSLVKPLLDKYHKHIIEVVLGADDSLVRIVHHRRVLL